MAINKLEWFTHTWDRGCNAMMTYWGQILSYFITQCVVINTDNEEAQVAFLLDIWYRLVTDCCQRSPTNKSPYLKVTIVISINWNWISWSLNMQKTKRNTSENRVVNPLSLGLFQIPCDGEWKTRDKRITLPILVTCVFLGSWSSRFSPSPKVNGMSNWMGEGRVIRGYSVRVATSTTTRW